MFSRSVDFFAVAGVAVAYYVSGRLALTLAIPPGYATAVWPAAGIALVAILVLGYRVWPGILVAHLFVNVFTAFDASSFEAGSAARTARVQSRLQQREKRRKRMVKPLVVRSTREGPPGYSRRPPES